MVGPVVSMERVPLRDVLPHDYLAAEDELRRVAIPLDSHPSAANRVAWHWYPEHNSPPPASDELRVYRLLVDLTISLYDADSDWLELTLDIAWKQPSKLSVNAAVEVACWCTPDHNMHQVRTASRQIANSHELAEAFAAAVAMLAEVLDSPLRPASLARPGWPARYTGAQSVTDSDRWLDRHSGHPLHPRHVRAFHDAAC